MTERLFAQQWLDVKRLNPNAPNIDLSLTFSLKFEQELGGRPLVHGPTISDVIADNEKLVHAVLAHVDLQPADTTVISQETEISPNLKVRIYTPPNYIENMPVGVFFHGGGWCLGDLNTEDPECRSFSLAAGVVIVSVGYRLAPLHKYPAALDDCLAAYKWAMKNSTFLKTAPDEAFLMGGSAGGNLALGVALRLIDEGHAGSLKGILAMVPVTCHPDLVPKEFRDMYKAYEENAEYSSNTTSAMMAFIGKTLVQAANSNVTAVVDM
jgi:versiconal hemiacetal acetate esterase